MAAATFCSMSHGYGVNKLNDYLLNRRNINRQRSKRQCRLCSSSSSICFHPDKVACVFAFTTIILCGRSGVACSFHCMAETKNSSGTDAGQRALCTRICFNKTTIRQLHSEGVHHGILLKCRAEHTESSIDQEKEERISTATLLWRAIKLPIYTVALVPITVGSAAAYLQTGQYFGKRYLMLVVSSVFIIAWLNLRELSLSSTILSSSILVGFTTSLILFCSHFHQVRLGTEGGAKVVKFAVGLLYSLLFILGLGQTLPFSAVVLGALTLPMGKFVVSFVEENHREKTKIFMAKYYCVRLHTLFGGALAAGLVAARFFARKQLPHAIILSP
ncbi:2-carboxy-1,4-naphthoquinone phytyltransferase, chloroplastic [Sesamum angolense]|uniref:2-carboxy-1,4-naphthoquinone phytyltransferase, chloroplastic n=1 Tax=Sesamum angolense TaxID=2727404 RepID=A0AAE1WY59_9LAMI|nr:2-carboxy-1,4-naphthoquinone phytyltransferase, chloroplastic [Sesamum angolense]